MTPQLRNNGWFPSGIPWAQFTPSRNPMPDDYALSYENGNQAVMMIQINAEDLYQAAADLLGSNIFNQSEGTLDRQLPMQHPIFQWLYCSRISSAKGYIPQQKTTFPLSTLNVSIAYPQYYVLTLLFQQPKYRMLSDARIDAIFGTNPHQEWQRFLQGWSQPKSEFVNVEAKSLQFAETGTGTGSDGSTGGPGPALNLPFPSQWSQSLNKGEFVVIWKKVPAVGLLNNGGLGLPINLINARNTVNTVSIFNSPVGTLKFENYKLIPLESPLPPEIQGGLEEGAPNLLFDVELYWSYFDPPYDLTANNNNPTRGHNLAPWRGNIGDNGKSDGTGNNLWYKLQTANGGAVLFPGSNHQNIFKMTA